MLYGCEKLDAAGGDRVTVSLSFCWNSVDVSPIQSTVDAIFKRKNVNSR